MAQITRSTGKKQRLVKIRKLTMLNVKGLYLMIHLILHKKSNNFGIIT